MSLTELELNQQLIEALADRDRLRTENARLAESACDGSIEQSHRDSTKAAIAALWETHPEIAYESPAQVIGWLRQRAEAAEAKAEDWRVKAGHFEMERDQARAALKRYGCHAPCCMPVSVGCTCGLDAALDPPAKEPKP